MKRYQDYKDKIQFPIIASIKLDGIFAVTRKGKYYSKNGKEFTAMGTHNMDDGVEGELFYHDYSFEEICSAVKRKEANNLTKKIKFIPHRSIFKKEIYNKNDLDSFLESVVNDGDEGLILHTDIGIFKYKPFFDEEYEILDVIEGKGKLKGRLGKLQCKGFTAPYTGNYDFLEKLWINRNSLIGKYVTVRYQNKTNKGIPRFPKGIKIRDYE